MSATRPAKYPSERNDGTRPPDLSHFRKHYPLTVSNFGSLPDREAWLRRAWEADERWREITETRGGAPASLAEVIVRGSAPSSLAVEAEFDVVYVGGALALLHAAVLAARYARRVLVLGGREGESPDAGVWNVSDEELGEFERAGLFTREEIEGAVLSRRRAGFVKFHDATSRVKAEPLWVSGVMDVGLDAPRILERAAAKIRAREAEGCALLGDARFVRAYVAHHRVLIEAQDARGARRLFGARLFVDASGPLSAVARQLNEGQTPATHVRPTVGTLARGFQRGAERDAVDFTSGEILVSTEDASDHRQLMWEGFGRDARRDEYATCLFFYDAVEAPADKSLLSLFERYFERLPHYKRRGAHWQVGRPVFGHVPAVRPKGWKNRAPMTADRVMLLNGATSGGPAASGGAGTHLRELRRLTHLTHLALDADMLDADALSQISSGGPRAAARTSSFADFLRPTERGAPSAVNETLNAVMAALHTLDERVRRELFQDRLSFVALRSLLGNTAKLYPRIFARVREHLGARGALWWLADVAEAVLHERRGRSAEVESLAAEGRPGDTAREFARHLALYEKERGADNTR